MRHGRILALVAAIAGVMVALPWGGEASAECRLCSTQSVQVGHQCYQLQYYYSMHKANVVTTDSAIGYLINHSDASWWCNHCQEVHLPCLGSEDPPIGGDEEELSAAFDSGEPAKLLAAVGELNAFVEHSTGRLVVRNCRGDVTDQYKLTADQIVLLSATPEHVSAADD
jgi:hypothetical protein